MFRILDSPPVNISHAEFRRFHLIDRRVYSVLVMDLWRDPLESMKIIAFWIWLERENLDDVVRKFLSLPAMLVNELADEAMTCINLINNTYLLLTAEALEVPLTQCLMQKEISLRYLRQNQSSLVAGITEIVDEVCVKALKDIMDDAIARNMASLSLVRAVNGNIGDSGRENWSFGETSNQNGSSREVHPDDRTMFVTFSKGYPVAEREVREFFTKIFGDCIESLYMQEVLPHEQSLFARVVFYTPSIIDMTLNGVAKAKFTINGKHVWMRKFVPKHPRAP